MGIWRSFKAREDNIFYHSSGVVSISLPVDKIPA
jgi:hypothetical protein